MNKKRLDYASINEETDFPLRRAFMTELHKMGLSIRAMNCLVNSGCRSLAEVRRRTDSDLLSWVNFGKKTLVEVRRILPYLPDNGEANRGAVDGSG